MNSELQLPENFEAEQSLLGSILVQNDVMPLVKGIVEADYFVEPLHREIFKVCADLIEAGRSANPITVKSFLPDETIGETTVPKYLITLASEAVVVIAAESFAEAIRDAYLRRRGIGIFQDGIEALANPRVDERPLELLSYARRSFSSLIDIEEDRGSSEAEIGDVVDEVNQQSADAMSGKKKSGMDTRFGPVTTLTGNWMPGQLIIIGAGSKQGKSALAMQCAMGVAENHFSYVWSGELSKEEITRREIARICGVSATRQRQGKITESELSSIVSARTQVKKHNLIINDKPMTLKTLDDRVGRLADRYGQILAVIDYIALIQSDQQSYRMSKSERCEYMTNGLKKIARKHGITICALSQLKKSAFDNNYAKTFDAKLKDIMTRRPKWSDLYGSIEQDADHVLIPFNARPLLAEIEPAQNTEDYYKWEEAVSKHNDKAQITLAISREAHFPQRVETGWDGPRTSFVDLRVDTMGRGMF